MPPKRTPAAGARNKSGAAAGTAPAAKRVKAEPDSAVAADNLAAPRGAPPPKKKAAVKVKAEAPTAAAAAAAAAAPAGGPKKAKAAAAAAAPAGGPTKAKAAAAPAKLPGPYPRPPCVSPVCAPLPARGGCGRLRFADLDPSLAKIFRPRLTPEQVIRAGSFGGIYFNPIGGRKGIYGRNVAIDASEFPASWFEGLPVDAYAARRYVAARNAFGVKAGQDQAFWEEKGWMRRDLDPRGWFQWYCRFYLGRRTTDGEDERQISRWNGVAGAKGRWRRALANKAAAAGLPADRAHEVSPVISQTLLHWADKVTDKDVSEALRRVGAA